jgi:chain length determinant protein (polysaccharide antigen chain regulator)
MDDKKDLIKQRKGEPHYLVIMNDQPNTEQGIDLFEIIAALYKKRIFIMSMMCLTTLIALYFALSIKPQYQVKTELAPPRFVEFQALNANADSDFTSKQLFNLFVKELSKKSNVLEYLEKSGVLDQSIKTPVSVRERISKLNSLAADYQVDIINHKKSNSQDKFQDNSTDAELTTISSFFDPLAKKNLAYLTYINKKILGTIIQDQRKIIQSKIDLMEEHIKKRMSLLVLTQENKIKRIENAQNLAIATLKRNIDALEKQDEREKQLRLEELQSALVTAKHLGITTNYQVADQANRHEVVIDVKQIQSELYLHGSKYLESEIALLKSRSHTQGHDKQLSDLKTKLYLLEHDERILALKNRVDNLPFIRGIEANQLELKRLKSLTFNTHEVSSFTLIGKPIIDPNPLKTNKRLIVIAGAMIGLLGAILIVAFQMALTTRREQILDAALA